MMVPQNPVLVQLDKAQLEDLENQLRRALYSVAVAQGKRIEIRTVVKPPNYETNIIDIERK